MKTSKPVPFQLPSYLYGSFQAIERATRQQGYRLANQYQQHGNLLPLPELAPVPFSELILAHEVVDFHRERPAWRAYMVGNIIRRLM